MNSELSAFKNVLITFSSSSSDCNGNSNILSIPVKESKMSLFTFDCVEPKRDETVGDDLEETRSN